MASYLEYLNAAMKKAQFERMENGDYFGSIAGFDGLWASGHTREEAARDLYSALDGWLDVHLRIGRQSIPPVEGVDLNSLPRLVED
ncbi:MAG: type II toxin-antitoxin system HicB family antitoxin [Candidatus Binatus sp.]|jgi:predicted RNase H-like HicB family nuclease|uniref:type II toxin-antitoxin system HicB family antitoxin n=1 Tax=Candidatus Binatus sp. TaxID=2811406 RepID=UPI003C786C89